jgi:hypothetical protein
VLNRSTVFHLHLDTADPNWLARINGQTYMGIPGFRVFHGQDVLPANTNGDDEAWRVDGRLQTTLTGRSGWRCPQDEGLWYIGVPDQANSDLLQAMQGWGETLYNQGYVARRGLRIILEPPNGGVFGDEIDPNNPGYVVYPPGGWTTTVGQGVDPYGVNWLIDERGLYNFFPARPPP